MIGGTKLELRNMNSIQKRLSLLFVLLYLHLKSGHSLLITLPRDTEVLVNHSTYFNCSTSIISEQIHWYHFRVEENQTNYVYYKGQFNHIYAERYSIQINNKTGEYNLIIRSVQPGDAGQYVCQDDVGLGHSSPAELIVLESPPTCLFSMKEDGLVGPNSCHLPLGTLQLSCSVLYNGNTHPILQWKMAGNDVPILEGITTDYSGNRAMVNLMMSSTVEMDGKYFTCGTTRSQDKQLTCSTDPVKINYAVGQPTILNITKGETITCSANASVPCTYRWFYDKDTKNPVSYNKYLSANRVGNHSCEASCPINGMSCTFVAIRIFIFEEKPSKTLLTAILISILVVLLIIACVLFFIIRKGRAKNPTNTAHEENNGRNVGPVRNKVQMQPLLREGTVTTDDVNDESISPDNEAGDNKTRVGEITTKASREKGSAIVGVAALEDTIYVVSDRCSDVEMFDIKTHEFRNRRNLVELKNPLDLTSCRKNKCLYIMDFRSTDAPKYVIKVNSNVKFLVQWSTGEEYGNLSVTRGGKVIVTLCDNSRRLVIYSIDGKEKKVVSLSVDIIFPTHSVKLSNGQFLICHTAIEDNIHRVCILNGNGEIIKSSSEKMKSSSYLAVRGTGLIFVADQGGKRVIVLNDDLELRELLSEQDRLRGPQRLFVHGQHGNRSTIKLFVVDNDVELESKRKDGKVLIFSYDLSLR